VSGKYLTWPPASRTTKLPFSGRESRKQRVNYLKLEKMLLSMCRCKII
jgi:hypothetical protein